MPRYLLYILFSLHAIWTFAQASSFIPDVIVNTTHQLYSYDEMTEDLEQLQQRYPEIVHYEFAETTSQGRRIPIVRFGGKYAPQHILVTASIHAREYMTSQLVMAMVEHYAKGYDNLKFDGTPVREIFDSVAIVLLPMVNPDGVMIAQQGIEGARTTKAKLFVLDDPDRYDQIKSNANGVDINRNFTNGFGKCSPIRKSPSFYYYPGATPVSEVESKMLLRVAGLHDYLCFLNYHTSGNLIYYGCKNAPDSVNKAALRYSNLIHRHTSYKPIGPSGIPANGSWADEVEVRFHRPSMTIEIGSRNPVPLEQFSGIYRKNLPVWPDLCRTVRQDMIRKQREAEEAARIAAEKAAREEAARQAAEEAARKAKNEAEATAESARKEDESARKEDEATRKASHKSDKSDQKSVKSTPVRAENKQVSSKKKDATKDDDLEYDLPEASEAW